MNAPITAAIMRNAGNGMNGHAAVSSKRVVPGSPTLPPARTKFSRMRMKRRNIHIHQLIDTQLRCASGHRMPVKTNSAGGSKSQRADGLKSFRWLTEEKYRI
jgi:hypothetical protein